MKFTVENMSCGHCVRAINNALHGVDAAAKVNVDLANKQVDVDSNALSVDQVIAILQEEGYPATLKA
ncbi:MAG: heavy-metal-associated domain-containing protein [Acinetobacter populi]|jgi:copper chaperone|uniref:heavy-metal-associated domain-containing protein n=1 Tax=Acinetobacter populi TaxID=1582270 RepID=UPI0023550518|nr:heavy-metal-associated domain-containing protein [Acinetobacter populi]MCH4246547.1 heavy-metal-associated domain-containing protein [Acinetobacter populi]